MKTAFSMLLLFLLGLRSLEERGVCRFFLSLAEPGLDRPGTLSLGSSCLFFFSLRRGFFSEAPPGRSDLFRSLFFLSFLSFVEVIPVPALAPASAALALFSAAAKLLFSRATFS